MAITTGVGLAIAGALGAGGAMYSANRANQGQNALMNAMLNNKIDPTQVGTNALNAQGSLAPGAIALNNQYAPQFAASNNNALLASLFGSPNLPGATNALTNNAAYGKLSPEIQNYLSNVANTQGMGAVSGILGGGNPYQTMLNIYQGTGGKLGTEEDAANFNNWVTKNFGEQWHVDGTGGDVLNQLGKDLGTTKSPGIAEMIQTLDKQLNPEQASALEALKAGAAVPSARITTPGIGTPAPVNQSGAAASLGAFMANGTAPQVAGPGGPNQGMDHLSKLLGSSSYQPINASQMAGAGGPNLAGNAALAAGPGNTPVNTSAAPVTIAAPAGFERIFANTNAPQVSGPAGFQSVSAPGSVQQVSAPGSFERVNAPGAVQAFSTPGSISATQVNAPNVSLDRLTVGQNTLLDNLQRQGFNANRPIQNTLEQQAMGDLSLGGQLSADQQRLAQQAARSAAEARGMVGSNSAILGEVQRQLDMSRALQNERRGFAERVEAQGFDQLAKQQGNAISAADVTNRFLGLGLEAGKANNEAALDVGKMALQAGIANQGAALDAAKANQATQLSTNIANQNTGIENNRLALDASKANQLAGLDLSRMGLDAAKANQLANLDLSRMGLQAGIANQNAGLDVSRMNLDAAKANQTAAIQGNDQALRANIANQGAGLDISRMGLDAAKANAVNAMNNNQFNATEQNQMARLLAELGVDVSKFNANQTNIMNQFNAGQLDSAADRTISVNRTNAELAQDAAKANQDAYQQNWMNQMTGATNLSNQYNTLQELAMNAAKANQGAWLDQRGQTMDGLNNLLRSDNDLAKFNADQLFNANKFNATMGMDAAMFNAKAQQQDFDNLAAYQRAVGAARFDPMAALGFANGQMNWGMFDPFNAAIASMYAANNQNAANAMMGNANNRAAINAGLMQGIGNLGSAIIGAYGKGGG